MAEETNLNETGYAAGRLIAFALKSAKPHRDSEYKQLIDRYIHDEPFAVGVDAVLEGMSLRILNETTQSLRAGLVLACTASASPFAPNIESHARGLNRDQQMAMGVIHLAVMSFYYPQVDDDDDDEFRSRSGTPSEIASEIREICEALQTAHQQDDSAGDEMPNQVRLAYEYYLSLQPAPTRAGYYGKTTQIGLVHHVLNELHRNGFLGLDGGDGPNTRYVSLPKYRIYVRRMSSHHLAQSVRKARRAMHGQTDANDAAVIQR
ncbi:hypothetical protein [Acanthopleuribacter pedis]|uniref:Uncharacterized protein n=1 Tax=Acanthopleuribacter pedis TaxID=442870 RepID=A0A8J7Q468_9BACT|nr:hypothetical protein [Acanthopleuribacter pedis]MBO1318900.1 hypothetical protein [Acanthopleuribacter pedis]